MTGHAFARSLAKRWQRRQRCRGFSSAAEGRVAATRRWLDSVVIGEKLCPFAAPVREEQKLKLVASLAEDAEALTGEVAAEAKILVAGVGEASAAETTLLVLDPALGCCRTWRDFVRLSWQLQDRAIRAQGFEELLQIVLFHPEAVHSAYCDGPEDAADFSIRAPFPVVHLLREMDVMKAVASYPAAEEIPARNKAKLRKQGLSLCQARLDACIE
ncbi:unnamed protein product [Effrenium voratum]|nr:unnamed protein product [Effrenium voratum]